MGAARGTTEERFWRKVDKRPSGCWLWTGHVDTRGYARLRAGGRNSVVLYAHRWSYEMAHGPIPEGYEVDHLCRVRACVNPAHLEAVPHLVNALRGQAPTVVVHLSGKCSRGHERNEENTYWRKDRPGKWNCRACRRERRARARLSERGT